MRRHSAAPKSWGNDTDRNLRPWGSYQWLPSDVGFREDGSTSIQSYINNLHPLHHAELYGVLEKAVDKAVPLWNECLSWFHDRTRIKVDRCGFADFKPPPKEFSDAVWAQGEDVTNFEKEWEINHWAGDNPDQRELLQPDPTEIFVSFEESVQNNNLARLDLRYKFPEGLQVIFKLANIELTPDNPSYSGTNWHVEGALNEHICATAIFYYGQENIEDSYLEFRHQIDAEAMIMKPEQNESDAAEEMYGIVDGESAVQGLGKVLTRSKRMLAFPNVMQHCVQPFGLKDPSKPGYRKILAMFLVDPHVRIISTTNVPPQQREWWAKEVFKIRPFTELPVEVFDRIVEYVDDFPIGVEEACETRERLMAERGRIQEKYDEVLHEVSWRLYPLECVSC